MKLKQLQDFFPAERHRDIEALYQRFAKQHGEDVEAFVLSLHEQGLLDTEVMRDVFTQHEITLTTPPSPEDDLPRLIERHQLIALLGKGAMGEVFLARDPDLKRTVAVKRIDPKHIKRAAFVTRFFAEAQITAQLDHPSIVPIYGVERDPSGVLSYAMKFVRGRTLKEYMDEARRFYEQNQQPDEDHSLKARIETLLPVLNAIDYAHRRGVIHRDLKPDNIMLGDFGEVLVMDWGIARPIGNRERVTESESVEKTRSGALVGTPSYMSPEQASGSTEELDGRSDQYALGLILFELVTLRRAIMAETSFETVIKAASGARAPLVHFNPKEKVQRELRAIIEKATAKKPSDRYTSVGDLADDLRRFLRDEAVLAAPDNAVQRVQRWIGRNRGLALGTGFALVMLVFVVAGLLHWSSTRELDAQREANRVRLEEQREANRQSLEEARLAAQKREEKLRILGALVSQQADRMSSKLHYYEKLLSGVVSAAATSLTSPVDEKRYYLPYHLNDPATSPPDLRDAKVYGEKISYLHQDILLLEEHSEEELRPQLLQLARLGDTMRRVALISHSDDALSLPEDKARSLILDEGVPLVWVYLGLENGLVTGYPGVWDYSSETEGEPYDPRVMPWYKIGRTALRPVWDPAGIDESGLGLLMTASQAITHPQTGEILGVAAVDLTFPYFINELLESERLKISSEAFLIHKNGTLLVRASQKEDALHTKAYTPPPITDEKVLGKPGRKLLELAQNSLTGHVALDDQRIAVWSHVDATGWLYVVVGNEAGLLDTVEH